MKTLTNQFLDQTWSFSEVTIEVSPPKKHIGNILDAAMGEKSSMVFITFIADFLLI